MFQARGIPVKDYCHCCLIGQKPYSMMRDDALLQQRSTNAKVSCARRSTRHAPAA